MTEVVEEFSSADSQEQSSSSYYSYLAKSFSEMVSEIPEMFISLKQYFKEKAMGEMEKEMSSIMNVFNLDNLLKLCTMAGIKSQTGVGWVKFAYHVMVAIYDFFQGSVWTKFGKYLELSLNDFTDINTLTHITGI